MFSTFNFVMSPSIFERLRRPLQCSRFLSRFHFALPGDQKTAVLSAALCASALLTSQPAAAQFVCGPTGTFSLLATTIVIDVPGTSAAGGSLACGSGTVASGTNATAVGIGAGASGLGSVSLGQSSLASASGTVALGSNASVTGLSATGIGANASANGAASVALGNGSASNGANSIAIGASASASGGGSIAIGNGVVASTPNQVAIGGTNNTYKLAGITSSASVSAQVGPVQLLTTDVSGNLGAIDVTTLLGGPAFDPTSINNQLANHEARLENVERKAAQANRGVAAAMALAGGANLPAGKKLAVSASWGTYAGENAFGTSAIAAIQDGLYVSGGVALTGSDVGGRAGVSVAW